MKKYTVVAVLTLCLCFGASVVVDAACTGSSPTWTSTPDQASVAACVASAVSGDTITVTAGSETWASSVSWTNKNLTLIGGSGGTTTISVTGDGIVLSIGARSGTSPTGTNPNTSRVTGFTFSCNKISIGGQGWRIDHNTFTCASLGTGHGIQTYYEYKNTATRGLIDNNIFINSMVLALDYAGVSSGELVGTTHWSTPLALGTNEATYIEDNTFTWTVFGHSNDCHYSGRYVFRFNVVNDTYIEAHSNQAAERACRKWEIYNNTIAQSALSIYAVMRLRGGTGLVFNNTTTGTFGYGIAFDNVRSGEVREPYGKCDGGVAGEGWDGNLLENGWPCHDQIGTGTDDAAWVSGDLPPPQTALLTPAYTFGNTINGANMPVVVINQSENHIVANRDFYDYTATFDGTTGVGIGVKSAMPATCTAGVAYWVTDQGYWNAKNTVFGLVQPSGALYKCTSGNFWQPYYVPFQYPHPLQSGLAAPTWP